MRGVSAIGAVGGGWCWERGLAAGGWVPGGVALGDWGIGIAAFWRDWAFSLMGLGSFVRTAVVLVVLGVASSR